MRILRYLAVLSILLLPAAYSQAQVSVGVGIGVPVYGGYGYGYPAPVCAYGYYGYYPYACAPYGYYGPSWFVGGIFIGAGPWYHSYGYRYGYGYRGGFYGRPVYGRPGYGYGRPGYGYGRPGYVGRPVPYHGGTVRSGFAGGAVHANSMSGGFHGGGGGFHGGGGGHGGGGHR
jgi:hypothetical protein